MSAVIDQIIPVTIKYGSVNATTTAFGIPLIVAPFLTTKTTAAFTTRTRSYSTLADMVTDGWATSDDVYLAAAAVFAQSPSVSSVLIGRRQVTETSPTALTADADWATTLNAIQAETDAWYAVYPAAYTVTTLATVITEQTQIAVWTEAQMKIAILGTNDANTYSSSSTADIASVLSTTKYNRVAVMYHDTATYSTEKAGAAWLGQMLPKDAGSATWAYKSLTNVTPDNLSVTQQSVALGKNANIYTEVSGVAITRAGKVAGGTYGYLDVTMGVDWIKTNIQAAVLTALASNDKIPYTDAGILAINKIVKAVLMQAAGMGIVTASSIVVSTPTYANISTANKTARNLPSVTFNATLAGAIQTVAVSGTVSV